MLRKCFALLLAFVLAASLAVNAAADLDPPLYAQLGYESLEELAEYTWLTAEQYQAIAEKAESFDPYAYYEASQRKYYEVDAQTYMEDWGMTEAEFTAEMLSYWFDEAANVIYQQQSIDQAIHEVGGVPGQINVLVNDRCVTFSDALPEIVNGRTMVPVRAVMEGMGAQVSYANGIATCVLGNTTVHFAMGAGEATVEKGADIALVELDAPSYLKEGRAYVPLRFLSEVSGWDVFWDKVSRTAVVVDRESAVAALDENLTILNEAMARQYAQYDLTKAYQFTCDFAGALTLLDSISGDETYRLNGDLSILWQGSNYEMEGSLDLGSLMDTLVAQGAIDQGDVPAELLPYLDELTYSAILSSEGYWISAPLLTYYFSLYDPDMAGQTVWIDAGSAYGMDMASLMALSAQLMEEGTTMGGILYDYIIASLEMNAEWMTQYDIPVYLELPNSLAQAKTTLDVLFGDDTFTKSGSSYTWHLSTEELSTLDQLLTGGTASLTDLTGLGLEMDMTLRADGSAQCDMTMTLSEYAMGAGYSQKPYVKLTMSAGSRALDGEMEMTVQIRNLADLSLDLRYTGRVSAETPAAQPPEGDVVLDTFSW